MEEIRIHGRGGQGVVTAAELIAMAAFYDGYEAQAFPNFGVERSGAPIQSFARIDKKTIITREQIYEPSILIIQDNTLLRLAELTARPIDAETNPLPKSGCLDLRPTPLINAFLFGFIKTL